MCNALWPKNHLQLCLLSHHVLDTVETSSAAGIINIIFPCMEVEDVSEKDELGEPTCIKCMYSTETYLSTTV